MPLPETAASPTLGNGMVPVERPVHGGVRTFSLKWAPLGDQRICC